MTRRLNEGLHAAYLPQRKVAAAINSAQTARADVSFEIPSRDDESLARAAAGAPTRFPSGWRARLGRDPMPILLREGTPALVARVRRDLIDDDEAPGAARRSDVPRGQGVPEEAGEEGRVPGQAAREDPGIREVRPRDRRPCARSSGWRTSGCDGRTPRSRTAVELLLSSQTRTAASASWRWERRPEARPRAPWRCTSTAGRWRPCVVSGYDTDARVERGFRYLLANRQADGGWAWRGVRTDSAARPSSHLVTGMALRSFAASPSRRTSREARRAAELLATRFLQPDCYPDRKAASYWEQIGEPRFYTDVLDALDGVTAVGLGKENSGVRTAEAYVRGRQNPDGLGYPGAPVRPDAKPAAPSSAKEREPARWLTVRVLIVLRRVN